ncbi:MAG: ComEC/Rec2 family competence protein [Candidatus Babeliales bacterium]
MLLQKNNSALHPLLPATIFFIAGIWLQHSYHIFYLSFLLFIIASALAYATRMPFYLIIGCSVLAGASLYQKKLNFYDAFQHYLAHKTFDCTLTITDYTTCNHRYLKHRFTGSIEKISQQKTAPINSNQHSLVWYCPEKPDVKITDTVSFENIVIRQPKQESMYLYSLKNSIAGTFCSKTFKQVSRPSKSFMRWLFEYRDYLLISLKKKCSRETFTWLALLFFGNKELDKKSLAPLQEDFKYWGISHYLARSGLHLVIFIAIWEFFLSLIPLSFIVKQILLIIISCIYVLCSWTSLSFARSLLGFFIYKLGILLEKPIHPLHLITTVTIATLAYNPFFLFSLDFQLSFGITFLLTWISFITHHKTTIIQKDLIIMRQNS